MAETLVPAPPGAATPALPLEPVVLRKALRRQASGFGAIADPFLEVRPGDGEGAVRRIAPGQAVGHGEHLDVGQAPVFVALEAGSLAARHFVELAQRKDDELAVLTDDGDMVARRRNDQRRGR